jgi:hypothetical protein
MTESVKLATKRIERAIHYIRDEKVMLDRDLASLYGVPTKQLNQAVQAQSGSVSARLYV